MSGSRNIVAEAVLSDCRRNARATAGLVRYALGDRVFFMHLPKTAGTTLKAYLSDLFPLPRICPAFEHVELDKLAKAERLQEFDLFQGHFSYHRLPESLKRECKFLTFVRHPLPRVISEWYQWSRRPEIFTDEIKQLLLRSHNTQVLMLSPLPEGDRSYSIHDHLEAAKTRLDTYFFVGVQERFSECMRALAVEFGRPIPADPIKLNVGRNKQGEVPGRSREDILDANWADVELYEHALDLCKRRVAAMQIPTPGSYASLHRFQGPAPRGTHYRMDDPLIGDGWYEREGIGSDAPALWRWTGPGLSSYIDFPLATDSDYRLRIRVLNAVSPEVLHGLQLKINGHDVLLHEKRWTWWDRLLRRPPPNGWVFEGRVSTAVFDKAQPFVRLEFVVPAVMRQCESDPNSTAERPIGVAVTAIDWVPV